MRCPSPGFCAAAGDYIDGHGHHQAFVVSQTHFAWGKAIPVPGLAALNNGGPTDIMALSCPSAGNCTVGGWFVDTNGNLQPFVAESVHGTLGKALALFTIDDQISQFTARVAALSCAKPRNCTAALILPSTASGGGEPIPQAFFITETNGRWGPLRPVPGISGPGMTRISGISSVSCWAPGDCMAVGGFGDVGSQQPILAVQEGGSWSAENTIPGLDGPGVIDFNPKADAVGNLVSCWAFTACTVAGTYGDHHGNQQVFVGDWVNGSWATQTIPGSAELNTAGSATENGLACGAAGNCAVAGRIPTDLSVPGQAFVDSRAAGDWSNAQEILGISNLPDSSAVAASCPATGSCLAGGHYTDTAGHRQAYVSSEITLAGTKDFGAFGGAQQIAGNLNTGGDADIHHADVVGRQGKGRPRAGRAPDRPGQAGHQRHPGRQGHHQGRLGHPVRHHAQGRQGQLHADREQAAPWHLPAGGQLRRRDPLRRVRLPQEGSHRHQVASAGAERVTRALRTPRGRFEKTQSSEREVASSVRAEDATSAAGGTRIGRPQQQTGSGD